MFKPKKKDAFSWTAETIVRVVWFYAHNINLD